jgi:hypothetical protein
VEKLRDAIYRLALALAAPAGRLVAVLRAALPGLIGLALLAVGAWMVYPPAGLITAGVLVLADRVVSARGERRGGDG